MHLSEPMPTIPKIPELSLHDRTLILTPTYNYPDYCKPFFDSIFTVLDATPDAHLVVMDNHSTPETTDYLRTLKHPQMTMLFLEKNIGKGNAVNAFIAANIHDNNLPKTFVSLDPDVTFSPNSFHKMVTASRAIPNMGMLGMRYTKNDANPEAWVFYARNFTGTDNTTYRVAIPFLRNVAGPVFALKGEIVRDYLNYEFYQGAEGKTYYPDDAYLHDTLKKFKCKFGYLEGTEATHLKTGGKHHLYDNTIK